MIEDDQHWNNEPKSDMKRINARAQLSNVNMDAVKRYLAYEPIKDVSWLVMNTDTLLLRLKSKVETLKLETFPEDYYKLLDIINYAKMIGAKVQQ